MDSVTGRVGEIKAQFPDLETLHGALSQGKLHKDIRAKSQKILSPYKGFCKRASDEIIRDITDERVRLCGEMMAKQNALADAGITRSKTLRRLYDFYVHDILGGYAGVANLDIWQQEFDVAVMFTLSHSQLKFAQAYAVDRPDIIAQYEAMLDIQERALMDFKKEQSGSILARSLVNDPPLLSCAARAAFVRDLQLVTIDVAQANLDLCEVTLNLFENQARAIYYWRLSLRGLSNTSLGASLLPQEDLNFESDLQKLYLERCQILADRAGDMCALVERLGDFKV